MVNQWRRFGQAVLLLGTVVAIGTVGYLALGFGLVNALYQTVTTVATITEFTKYWAKFIRANNWV